MTDTQIGPAGGPAILYQNFASLWLLDCTVSYSGSLGTLQSLYVGSGATFIWG